MLSPTSRTLAVAVTGLGLAGALAACSSTSGTDAGAGSDNGGSSSNESYADGTYEADGSYQAPSGTEHITVELTLSGDAVTDVTVTPHATDPTAKGFQNKFVGGIAAEVDGQDIDTLNVTRVSGSSLTSGGFRAAIEEIKKQALA